MNQLFKDQTNVQIELDTKIDLAGYTNTKILVVKPNTTKAEWQATITGTKLLYELQSGDIDITGTYNLQAYAEKAGRKSFGKKINIEILENNLQ